MSISCARYQWFSVLPACFTAASLTTCMPPRASAAGEGAVLVEVVDMTGAPLAGVEVEGLVDVNPGLVASTCCIPTRFAEGTTSRSGRVMLTGAPRTFRSLHVRATYGDWPTRHVVSASLVLGPVRVVLAPPRVVSGRVELGPDCPRPPELEVVASPPPTRARVAADGSFRFNAVAPWAYISLRACNRLAHVELDVGDNQPVVLTLPPASAASPAK